MYASVQNFYQYISELCTFKKYCTFPAVFSQFWPQLLLIMMPFCSNIMQESHSQQSHSLSKYLLYMSHILYLTKINFNIIRDHKIYILLQFQETQGVKIILLRIENVKKIVCFFQSATSLFSLYTTNSQTGEVESIQCGCTDRGGN